MNVFGDLRADYAGKLAAAGLTNVTTDPNALVPFVLVDAISGPGTGAGVGGWQGNLPIRIVAAPPGDGPTLAGLEEQLQVVLVTLGAAPFSADTYGPKELPAYTVTYPVTVPNPNC